MAISFSLYGVSTVCDVTRPPFSISNFTLRMMFVPLRIFEQTRPCAKELLFHDLDKFVSPFGWTHAGFKRFFVKPSPMFPLCFCDYRPGPYVHAVFWGQPMFTLCFCNDIRTTYLHAVFLQLTWTNFVSLWDSL